MQQDLFDTSKNGEYEKKVSQAKEREISNQAKKIKRQENALKRKKEDEEKFFKVFKGGWLNF